MKKKKIIIIVLAIIVLIIILCVFLYIEYKNLKKDDTKSQDEDLVYNEDINILEEDTVDSNRVDIANETISTNIVEVVKEEESNKENKNSSDEKINTSTTSSNKIGTTNKTEDNNNKNDAVVSETKSNKPQTSEKKVENESENNNQNMKDGQDENKNIKPARCTNNNNHGMAVGNSGMWFETKEEAIAYYDEKISYWGKLWENFKIDDDTYKENCPSRI